MVKKVVKEIEVRPEILEEKVEGKKKKGSSFNQSSSKGNPRLLFFWMTILVLVWLAFSLLEVSIRFILSLFSGFKDRVKNKTFRSSLKSCLTAAGYTCGCIIGIAVPNLAIRLLQKIENFSSNPSHIFAIIQSIFNKYRH